MRALRIQGRALRSYAINRRMIAEGLAVGADVFHAHDVNTLWVATQCKKRTNARLSQGHLPSIPLIYDSHEFATERNRMGWWWRRRELWNERRGLAHADGLIVVTPDWIPKLQQLYGTLPPHRVTVTNVPEKRAINPRNLRSELDIPPEDRILIYQGTIQENRGIEPVIEAVQQLDRVVLVLIGYGYYRPELEKLVAEQNLGEKVKFFGPVPHTQLLDWAAAGDIGICNVVNLSYSYFTTIPNKLTEYFMAGLPVIGSDSPGIGRVIKEHGAGITVDPLSSAQIAEAVQTILANPEPYQQAARRSTARYNWDVESQHLLQLYQQVLSDTNLVEQETSSH